MDNLFYNRLVDIYQICDSRYDTLTGLLHTEEVILMSGVRAYKSTISNNQTTEIYGKQYVITTTFQIPYDESFLNFYNRKEIGFHGMTIHDGIEVYNIKQVLVHEAYYGLKGFIELVVERVGM